VSLRHCVPTLTWRCRTALPRISLSSRKWWCVEIDKAASSAVWLAVMCSDRRSTDCASWDHALQTREHALRVWMSSDERCTKDVVSM
jgi:hypothetical protein